MILEVLKGNEWQFLSKEGDCILPWYTRPALDVLEQMDLSGKVVFEYGIGMSTIWFAKHCKKVYGIETNKEWFNNIADTLEHHHLLSKTELQYMDIELTDESNYIYSAVPFTAKDIIVIDGQYRDETAIAAIRNSKEDAIIILDNYLQESVHVASQIVQDLVNEHPHTIYKQEGHPDWTTCLLLKQ